MKGWAYVLHARTRHTLIYRKSFIIYVLQRVKVAECAAADAGKKKRKKKVTECQIRH